jgi:glycosyltransferase involved in cell wall biosynthesis
VIDFVTGRAARVAGREQLGAGERIVLYTSSECWRGAGVSYVNIARGLENHGFRPHVVSMCEEVTEEFRAAGVPVTQTPRGRGEAMRLRALLPRLGADAVMVDRAHDVRVATLATLGRGLPVINRYNHFRPTAPSDLLIRVAYAQALSDVVFLSSTARERVLRETPFMRRVRPVTIHEGIDTETFRPSRRDAIDFRRTFDIGLQPFLLAVGALSPEKRYDVLFDALRLLGPNAPLLVVCGEGAEQGRLLQRAASLQLNVRLLGRVQQSVLTGAYSASLGLVHAGSCETFGLAVLEAMACARPVVVAAGGALPEVVGPDGGSGLLAEADSVGDLALAIETLLADREAANEMGQRARARASTMFSLQLMEYRYAAVVAGSLRRAADVA